MLTHALLLLHAVFLAFFISSVLYRESPPGTVWADSIDVGIGPSVPRKGLMMMKGTRNKSFHCQTYCMTDTILAAMRLGNVTCFRRLVWEVNEWSRFTESACPRAVMVPNKHALKGSYPTGLHLGNSRTSGLIIFRQKTTLTSPDRPGRGETQTDSYSSAKTELIVNLLWICVIH